MSSNRSLAQRQAIAAATATPDLIGAMMAFSSAGGLDDTTKVDVPEPDAVGTDTPAFDLKLTGDVVEGLRALADLIETNPHLAEYFRYSDAFRKVMLPVSHYDDPRASMAEWVRAGKGSGHPVVKDYDSQWGSVTVVLSDAVKIWAYAKREQVCTRVVTGTEIVTVTIPDPAVEVPMVEVEQTREIVEWRCEPLLSGNEATA